MIDNFDSSTQNIAQYLYEMTDTRAHVVTNSLDYSQQANKTLNAVVSWPGSGHPAETLDLGMCDDAILRSTIPVLCTCLGHQCIAEFLGGNIAHAHTPHSLHGYRSHVTHCDTGLFQNLPEQFELVRYHSLFLIHLFLDIKCTAWTIDGLVMAIEQAHRHLWSVKFNPKSIDPEYGHALLGNFVTLVREHNALNRAKRGNAQISFLAKEAYLTAGGKFQLQLHCREPGSRPDPLRWFTRLYAHDRTAFWLDSEQSDCTHARFSFLGGGKSLQDIQLEYDVSSQCLSLKGRRANKQIKGDCFTPLDQIVQAVQFNTPAHLPFSFKGSLIGYPGYEFKAQVGGRQAYRSPYPGASLIMAPHFFVFNHLENILSGCRLSETELAPSWPVQPPATAEHEIPEDLSPPFISSPVCAGALALDDNPEAYLKKVKQLLKYISDRKSYEICLTNRTSVAYSAMALSAYARMRQANPPPYGALLRLECFSVLSASNENFLKIDDYGFVESRPIKGNRQRSQNPAEDVQLHQELVVSARDRAKHLMIVDSARHELNQIFRPGGVHVPSMFAVESFSSVHQLASKVREHLAGDISALKAIQTWFPSKTMTGLPKLRTMEFIDKMESSARAIYSSALGWLSSGGAAQLSCVIRTATLQNEQAEFYIGGKIVACSDPFQELEQTLLKANVPFYSACQDTPT
ncbi:chorismate-binding protein [Pseudomonas koreensis]|uniref:chorismate-binding protein n=1 Tax=Pseudomonas koreensis TaxID=198620 RepID=UPI003F877476